MTLSYTKAVPASPTGPNIQNATAPRWPLGFTAPRRPASIRRTSTLDTDWPDGRGAPTHVQGRARDLITRTLDGDPQVMAQHRIDAVLSPRREILQLTCDQMRPNLDRLIGVRAGGHLREAIETAVPEDRRLATPLHLLLDDLAGASLVAGWAWSHWIDDWTHRSPSLPRVGVCTGFAPGASSLNADGSLNANQHNFARVLDLRNPVDPNGWHAYRAQSGVGMRRARRMDVWIDSSIYVEIGFQDSATLPDGGRAAVHEYLVSAIVDPMTDCLLAISADPRVLPFKECPSAALNIRRLIGASVSDFRRTVIDTLRGVDGCTHLNDVLRSLADVPNLVDALRRNANN